MARDISPADWAPAAWGALIPSNRCKAVNANLAHKLGLIKRDVERLSTIQHCYPGLITSLAGWSAGMKSQFNTHRLFRSRDRSR